MSKKHLIEEQLGLREIFMEQPTRYLVEKRYIFNKYSRESWTLKINRCLNSFTKPALRSRAWPFTNLFVSINVPPGNDWNTTCNYFESLYLVQRLTVSMSSHSSLKFNVQRRTLDCVAGISHSAPQPTHQVSTLRWTKKFKSKIWILLGMKKTTMLDCILHRMNTYIE